MAGPTKPNVGMRIIRRRMRKVEPTQVLIRKRLCSSSAAKRYRNKVERKNGTSPRPRSCIAGSAGKNLAPRANRMIGLDHVIKKAANGILTSAKNFMLHWYASLKR